MVPFLSRLFNSHYDSLEFNEMSKKAVYYVVEHTLNYSRCWCWWENDIHKLLENLTAPNTKWHVYFWCNWDTFPEVCNPQLTFVCVLSLCVCCFLLIYFQIDFFFECKILSFEFATCRCWIGLLLLSMLLYSHLGMTSIA